MAPARRTGAGQNQPGVDHRERILLLFDVQIGARVVLAGIARIDVKGALKRADREAHGGAGHAGPLRRVRHPLSGPHPVFRSLAVLDVGVGDAAEYFNPRR